MNAFDVYTDDYDGWDDLHGFDEFDELDGMEDFAEGDEFIRRAYGWLTRPGSTQRRVALGAARAAIGSLGTIGGAVGKRLGGGIGETAGNVAGSTIGGALGGLLPDQMDYFAELAADSADEADAEAFLGALVPLAARMAPQVGQAIMRVAPQLIRGIAGTARALHANPASRQLLRTMGTVVRRTGADIARQAARGRPVSGQMAVRRLAHHTHRVMRDPRQVRQAIYRRRRAA